MTNSEENPRNRIVFTGPEGRASTSPKPGFLVVDARLRLNTPHATGPFRWQMKVGRDTRPMTLVREFSYDHQAFNIGEGRTADLTFHEETPLPPGRYRVMLQVRSYKDAHDARGKVVVSDLPVASEVMSQIVP